MIKYGHYIMVTDIEELQKSNDFIYERGKEIYIAFLGVFHLENANFPQCFKYVAPWDNHCCGDYIPCDKTEMISVIENTIEELTTLKNKLVDNI